jgi:hypothetical protein
MDTSEFNRIRASTNGTILNATNIVVDVALPFLSQISKEFMFS